MGGNTTGIHDSPGLPLGADSTHTTDDPFTTTHMSSTVPPSDALLSLFDCVNGDCSTLTAVGLVCKLFEDSTSKIFYETVVNDPSGSKVRSNTDIFLLDSI